MKQSDIVKKIRKLGYKVTVLTAHPANRGGIPDTIISWNGLAVFLEIKINDDKLSKLQENFRDEFWASWMMLHYDSKTKKYTLIFVMHSNKKLAYELDEKLNAI